MGILSARSLTQALSQARNVGLVEEPFVLGDISLVVRNLRPEQYDSIFKECQGLSDVEYLNAWQLGHVSRAICELNGIDLRDTTFVEDEEPDPKKPNQTRVVKHETHTWLQKNILATWGREAIFISYRKVADAIEAAEKKAQEGVTFKVADEDVEERARRLIGEFKEIESEVPPRILETILAENGLARQSTQEEFDAADAKLAEIKPEEGAPAQSEAPVEGSSEPPAAEPPAAEPPAAEPPAADQRKAAGPPTPERMAQLLRNRVPMNQQPEILETSLSTHASQEAQQTVVAYRPPMTPPPQAVSQSTLSGRSVDAAALEMTGLVGEVPAGAVNLQPQDTIPEVRLGSTQRVDPAGVQTILDQPPVGGINPRYRPPVR